jgi:hypothetical protein
VVQEPHDPRPTAEARPDAPPASIPRGPNDELRPIGPERLQWLREAIRNGTYPTDDDVLGGLTRMMGPG